MMEKNLARHVIRVAFRTAGELQQLLSLLKQECGPDEYRAYASGIAKAVDTINAELTNKIISSRPDLESEIESDLAKFGRVL